MASRAELAIKILVDSAKARSELDKVTGSGSKVGGSFRKMAAPAAAVLGIIGGLSVIAGKAASDTQQAMGAVESVFKDSADAVKASAKGAAQSVGLAASQYGNLAAVLGSQLKGMGTAADKLAPKTDELISLGADLAATYGGTTAQAVEAVSSLLRGERDPIEKYGVAIKQVDVNAQLAAMGLDKTTGAARTQAEAQATLALLTKKTADAQGQFAREADSAAGAAQISAAQYENAKAALGTALLPVMAKAATVAAALGKVLTDNAGAAQIAIAVIAGLAAVILVVNGAMAAWGAITAVARGATLAWTAAQWLLNAAMSANPVGLVVLAIVALIAVLVIAWKKSETFRTIVTGAFNAVLNVVRSVWSWIRANWPLLLAILAGPIGLAVLAIARHWDKVKAGAKAVLDWLRGAWQKATAFLTKPFEVWWSVVSAIITKIQNAIQNVLDLIGRIKIPKLPDLNPFSSSRAAPAVAGAAAMPLAARSYAGVARAPAVGRATATGGGPTIIVQGALDPEGVARQIQRILAGHAVRVGRAGRTGRA